MVVNSQQVKGDADKISLQCIIPTQSWNTQQTYYETLLKILEGAAQFHTFCVSFKWPLNNSDNDSAPSYIINISWNWYLTETILENNKIFEINFDQDLFWLHDSAQQFSIKQDIALNSDLRDKNPFIKLLLIRVLLCQKVKM